MALVLLVPAQARKGRGNDKNSQHSLKPFQMHGCGVTFWAGVAFFHPSLLLCGSSAQPRWELAAGSPRGTSVKHNCQGTQQCQHRAQHFLSPPWKQSQHMVQSVSGCAQPASLVGAFCFPDFLFLVRFMNLRSQQLGTGSDPASLPVGQKETRLVTQWLVACNMHMLLLSPAVHGPVLQACSQLHPMQPAPSWQ